ncbi:ParA family protein [Marinoscillum sp. 108]|uniref:ParA family protein n=1 Tax=Marinoscillum sp. 108 TaxID=2653151 RepID=UPI0012F0F89E|nr:ParA family protein [Marinoscillum sp. 108]VXD12956.1 Chromosome partitioning protein [Marinoscillum sp. 108]
MSNTVSIYNFKGGVGKTTTALNLGISWSRSFKVLLIDFDPQCNLTNAITIEEPRNTIYNNIRNLLHDHDPDIEPLEITPYLHIIPGDFQMTQIESNNQFISFGTGIIARLLSSQRREYDFIIMDCPTNFGVLVKAILGSSKNILIPAQADSFSITGIQTLMGYLNMVENSLLNILGVFFNMYNNNLILSQEKFNEAKNSFGNLILDTTVSRSIKVGEALDIGQAISDYSPDNTAAVEFMKLSDELLAKFLGNVSSHVVLENLNLQE